MMVCLITGFWILDVVSVSAKEKAAAPFDPNREIVEAAPYIERALMTPMADLYQAAAPEDPDAMLVLGLALYAGRTEEGRFTAKDEADLAALDGRILEPLAAYLRKHPDKQHITVNWRQKFRLKKDEAAVVDRYQKAHLADFWLGYALTSASVKHGAGGVPALRPAHHHRGRKFATGNMTGWTPAPVITYHVSRRAYSAAVNCIWSLREAAGSQVTSLTSRPPSMRIFRNFIHIDTDAYLAAQWQPESGYLGPMKAAACGTPAQFNTYLAKLTAVTGAP
ncbi:hypothetical protein ABAC402_11895 [Asticcacaulis sp. AC402]|nr:hypothetical protein ABAC402_11895 [Asticcacaulis sp. AC402]